MQTEQCWNDVQQRNTAADGRFVYSVRSTGVYCRPSCASRPARRENVAFHPNCAAAEAAGFRACKRCDPRGTRDAGALIAALCRHIDAADAMPSLADLARKSGYSRYHLHRLFKAATGLTPRAYAAGRRADRLRARMAAGTLVTTAIYDAGFNAPSRFYADAPALLGMAPGAARRGGAGETIGYTIGDTSLGTMLIAASAAGICAISLGEAGDPLIAALHRRFPAADLAPDLGLAPALAKVVGLIEQGGGTEHLPLDLRGSAFQMRVWQALRGVKRGETLSYSDLAARIGAPKSVRAVARACATNEVAVMIPCHRIVAADGSLTGYRWGLDRKRALLEAEQLTPSAATGAREPG